MFRENPDCLWRFTDITFSDQLNGALVPCFSSFNSLQDQISSTTLVGQQVDSNLQHMGEGSLFPHFPEDIDRLLKETFGQFFIHPLGGVDVELASDARAEAAEYEDDGDIGMDREFNP